MAERPGPELELELGPGLGPAQGLGLDVLAVPVDVSKDTESPGAICLVRGGGMTIVTLGDKEWPRDWDQDWDRGRDWDWDWDWDRGWGWGWGWPCLTFLWIAPRKAEHREPSVWFEVEA
jgi:hypothetical protein